MNEQVNNAIGGYEAETTPLDLQATIKTDNTQALYSALSRIAEQQACIDKLVEALENIVEHHNSRDGDMAAFRYFMKQGAEALAYVRDNKELCVITYSTGETYRHDYTIKESPND